MYWRLVTDKEKTLGFDNFYIDIYAGNWRTYKTDIPEQPKMSISIFEVLDSLPREFVERYIKWLNEVETHVPKEGQYSERK